ncbi:hypothetical protein AVEN_122237-1 [Araneus ventricosus]|uniref:Uncharacterized protein n=1 Tax=Araneus ventricosus TaxID=182803 RepID=A0A4Y1ZUQ1_ARAVE|nr:hypothetical protein AVEN_122237-1 [Araneus ventricosus]
MNYNELPPESDLTETDEAIGQMETYLEEIEVSLTYLKSKHNIDDKSAKLNIKANKTEKLLSVKLPDILLPQFSRREAKLIQTTDDTYKSLLKALEDRYENKRAIVDSHISSLINQEKLSYESGEDLRKMLDTVKKNLRTLKTLKYERNNLSDVLIMNLILQKLDKETRKQLKITLKKYSFEDTLSNTVKALGMPWRPQPDELKLKASVNHKDSLTNREVLSQISRLCDPLGIVGLVIAKAKIFMQSLWLQKLDWNDNLPTKVLQVWNDFLVKLPAVNEINVPRYILSDDVIKFELHDFSYSSEHAYGAVPDESYIRCATYSGLFQTRVQKIKGCSFETSYSD